MSLKITNSGLHTTIQDQGREGYQRYGFSVSGAMDTFSYRLSNLLVGNESKESVIEMAMTGASFAFTESNTVAITGADCSPRLNGKTVRMNEAFRVNQGDELTTKTLKNGTFSYVAFSGGLKIPEVMGSQSTSVRYGVGGVEGRRLLEGDVIEFKAPLKFMKKSPARFVSSTEMTDMFGERIIRVIPNKEEQLFNEETLKVFFNTDYLVSAKSDRMGYRLEGAKLKTVIQEGVLSEGTVLGNIQVPPNGQPIVLLADRQTTGGYPVIGTICSVDIPKIVQCKPGEKVRLKPVTLEDAQLSLKQREETFAKWVKQWEEAEQADSTVSPYEDGQEHAKPIEWDNTKIKEVISAVNDSSLAFFSFESDNIRLMLDKRDTKLNQTVQTEEFERPPFSPSVEVEIDMITSTLVGVFYTHSYPGHNLFIEVGDSVQTGQIVGRIEALNLSNDVIALKDGTVRSILVENDQMVEYGQPLIEIEYEKDR